MFGFKKAEGASGSKRRPPLGSLQRVTEANWPLAQWKVGGKEGGRPCYLKTPGTAPSTEGCFCLCSDAREGRACGVFLLPVPKNSCPLLRIVAARSVPPAARHRAAVTFRARATPDRPLWGFELSRARPLQKAGTRSIHGWETSRDNPGLAGRGIARQCCPLRHGIAIGLGRRNTVISPLKDPGTLLCTAQGMSSEPYCSFPLGSLPLKGPLGTRGPTSCPGHACVIHCASSGAGRGE